MYTNITIVYSYFWTINTLSWLTIHRCLTLGFHQSNRTHLLFIYMSAIIHCRERQDMQPHVIVSLITVCLLCSRIAGGEEQPPGSDDHGEGKEGVDLKVCILSYTPLQRVHITCLCHTWPHYSPDKGIFAAKRREQIETAEKILHLPDYAKQYKVVMMLMETVFSVSESVSCSIIYFIQANIII